MYLTQKCHEQDMDIRSQVVLNAKLFIMAIKLSNIRVKAQLWPITTNLHLNPLKIQKYIVLVKRKKKHHTPLASKAKKWPDEIASACHTLLAGVGDSFLLSLSHCPSWPLWVYSFQNPSWRHLIKTSNRYLFPFILVRGPLINFSFCFSVSPCAHECFQTSIYLLAVNSKLLPIFISPVCSPQNLP